MDRPATKKVMVDDVEMFESVDGSQHKTRSGAYKRTHRVWAKAEEPEPEAQPELESAQAEIPDDEEPAWASTEWAAEEGGPSEYVPGVLKKIRPPTITKGKPTAKQLNALRETNIAILKVGYRSGDHVLTVYRRAALKDPDAERIRHSEDDYEWISDITNSALENNGFSIGTAIGPTQVALLANGYWFGKPLYETSREAQKRGLGGKMALRVRSLGESLPWIGKRIKARRHRMAVDEILGSEQNE